MAVIPIFISSTFRDFHAERDELVTTVRPALDDLIAEYGCRVELIDLRWGVAAAEGDAEQARVLEVCLQEIKRANPLFVGLLGKRYGWVPDELRLASAAQEAGIDQYPHDLSATALEFEYGALQRSSREALFLARTVVGVAPPDWQDSDSTRVTALQARVRERCEVHDYRVTCDGLRPIDLSDFVECAIRVLGPKVVARAREIAGDHLDPVTAAEALFFDDRLRAFDGRAATVTTVVDLIGTGTGVCLTGESGAGKSSVWCGAVARLRTTGVRVVAVPVGASPAVTTARAALLRACTTMGYDVPPTASIEEVEDHLRAALRASAPVVLAIDAIDQLPGQPRPTFLAQLPDGVTALVSTTSAEQARYARALTLTEVGVAPLGPADGRSAIGAICTSIGRTLPAAAVDRLAAEARSPLWLRLAIAELSALDADDFGSVDPGADPLAEIARLVVDTVSRLPATTEELLAELVDRVCARFGEDPVVALLSLAAVSRSGLRPSDFEALIGLDALTVAGIRRGLSGLLVERGEGGRLGFAHAVVRGYVTDRFIAGKAADLHQRLADHLADYAAGDPVCQEDQLWHLLRGNGSSAGPILNAVPAGREALLTAVMLDSLSIPGAGVALSGLDPRGIAFLTSTVLEHKSNMRVLERIMLSASIFAEARAYAEQAAPGSQTDTALLAVAAASSCLSDLPNAADVDLRPAAEEAYEFTQWLVAMHPDSLAAHEAHAQVANFLSRFAHDDEHALVASRTAVAEWQWVAARAPSLRVNSWLQFIHSSCGDQELKAGNVAAARDHFTRALPLARELLDANDGATGAKINVVNALVGLGEVAAAEGEPAQTLEYFGEAAALARSAYLEDPTPSTAQNLASTARVFGMALSQAQRLDDAHEWLTLADDVLLAAAQADPHQTGWAVGVDAAARAAATDVLLGRPAEARRRLLDAVANARKAKHAISATTQSLVRVARELRRSGAHQDAIRVAQEAVGFANEPSIDLMGYQPSTLADAYDVQMHAHYEQGNIEAAAAAAREVLAIRRSIFDDDGGQNVTLARQVGIALLELATILNGAERDAVVLELAEHWETQLADDTGGDDAEVTRINQRLGQRLTGMAFHTPAAARVLLTAALRYVHRLWETDPQNVEYNLDFAGVTQAGGIAAANSGNLEGGARALIIAAKVVEEQPRSSASPRVELAARELAASLRWIASKPTIDRDVAANCLFHAEQLSR